MGVAVAEILRHQKIFGRDYKPGDILTAEEYDSLALENREALESTAMIRKIFDADAARVMDDLIRRVEILERQVRES